MSNEHEKHGEEPEQPARRTFLSRASSFAMLGGLGASYGTFAAYAAKFLYPARLDQGEWQFLAAPGDIEPGAAVAYETPAGAKIAVARIGNASATG